MTGPWAAGASFGPAGFEVHGHGARDLAAEYGTPLVVVDERHVRERCREFREAFDRVLWAVKAFPVRGLIGIALDEGLDLLAATGGELAACLRAGAPGDRVMLHGNNKSDDEIAGAIRARVGLISVDNEEELERIDGAARAADVVQPVLLRLAPGIDVDAHEAVKTGAPDTKFGIPVAGGLARSALKRALELPALRVRGVHLHLGSQLLDARPFEGAATAALNFLAEARDAFGFTAEALDVGGGFGAVYTDEDPRGPEEVASTVRSVVEEGCAARELPVPELIVEPGRAITCNAAATLYRVGAIKEVPGIRTYVAVDGGMSDNIRPALYGARYTVGLASRRSDAEPATVTVVGRHCESDDLVARDVPLPADLRRGDLLAVAATGAYEYAMAGGYNKVGRPAVALVGVGTSRLIARREDDVDLARLDLGDRELPEARPPRGVEIRAARPSDARGVRDHVAQVAAEGRYIRMERVEWSLRMLRRRFRRSWTRANGELVAVAGGEIVGNLSLSRETHPSTRHVASLGMSVAPQWRGVGVGSALLAEAFRWAGWAGVEKIALAVYPHNERALALYRKFGFVEEGRLSGHSKKSHGYDDEVIMGRWL